MATSKTLKEAKKDTEFSEKIPLDSQFRSYMEEIEKVLAATSTKEKKEKNSSNSNFFFEEFDLERLHSLTVRPDLLNIPKHNTTDTPPPDFLTDLKTLNHGGERANVSRFLRDFDQLKRQVKELTGQNALLLKDKAFLTGRNEYLETSNRDLTGRLTAVSAQATSLQQSKEDLLEKTHLIHEKDRSHYLQSFQKVLSNLESEKMKELNKAVRKQVQAYQAQITELQAAKTELFAENSSMKKELEILRRKLNDAELTSATNSDGQSQNYSELQLSLMARTHELQQTKIQLGFAEENLLKSQVQLDFLKERNRIITQEYERIKKDGGLMEKQEVIDRMLKKIGKLESELEEKSANLENQTGFLGNEEVKKMTEIIRQQEREIDRLMAHVQKLTTDLRTEKEMLERVRKTRDELYDVVRKEFPQ